jgi:hypothetical protein
MGVLPYDTGSCDPAERQMYARDAQASATLLSLLIFLWGAVSIAFVPLWRFGVYNASNAFQVVVGALGLVYFLRTRERPRLPVALGAAVFAIVYTLVLVFWTSIIWCDKGRPWEAFTVPHAAIVTVALVMPYAFWLGTALMGLFAAEGFAVYLYALHRDPGLVPVTEPVASITFAIIGIGLLVMRDRRRKLALQHIRLQSEVDAFRRVGPLFAHVHEDLEQHLARISSELDRLSSKLGLRSGSPLIGRSIGRLKSVSRRLGGLANGDHGAEPEAGDLLARDARLGATVTAAVAAFATAVAAAVLAAPTFLAQGSLRTVVFLLALSLLGFLLLLYLVVIRQRLSERRARWLVVALIGAILPLVSYNQTVLLGLHRPFTPLLGFKYAMVVLGLVAVSRRFMGIGLIVATALNGIVLYFVLGMGAQKDRIPLAEPWIMLVFMVIAIALQVMQEHRRVASIRLLRAQAEISALHRRAHLLEAAHDQLGSPLQALVLGLATLEKDHPPEVLAALRLEIKRLLAVNAQLHDLEEMMPGESRRASFDGAGELRRRTKLLG